MSCWSAAGTERTAWEAFPVTPLAEEMRGPIDMYIDIEHLVCQVLVGDPPAPTCTSSTTCEPRLFGRLEVRSDVRGCSARHDTGGESSSPR